MQKLDISKLEYVLFDWDNTLVESRTPLLFAMKQVLEEKNLPSWESLKEVRDNNISFKANFKNFFKERAEEVYARYAEIYLQNVERLIGTFPKVLEVLEWFKNNGITLIIMSNKDRKLLDFELPLLFPPEYFKRVVCGCEAPRDKPHKEHVLFALEGLLEPAEINRQNVWVVGDSPQDSAAALAAGALPIRIGTKIWNDCEKYEESVIYFKDFADFYECLKEQN